MSRPQYPEKARTTARSVWRSEDGRPQLLEDRGRLPRRRMVGSDGWVCRPTASQAQIFFQILSPDGIPCRGPVSLGGIRHFPSSSEYE